MDKKEYIAKQLSRAVHKKYENYCITRIIHKLDNLDVQFITQQLFKRPDGKFAYADLYFPQLNISVEIDESHHLNQKEEDEQRTKDIIETDSEIRRKYTGLEDIILDPIEVLRISANQNNTIEEINSRTDEVVEILKGKITELGNKFIPWKNIYEDASYYLERKYIDVCDNAKFRIIADICKLFHMPTVSMYDIRHGYIPIKKDEEYLWCPTLKLSADEIISNNAENTISNDGEYIYEYFKTGNDDRVREALKKEETRYVFVHYKDEIGHTSYKFIGVYCLDKEKTKNKRVWKRIKTRLTL